MLAETRPPWAPRLLPFLLLGLFLVPFAWAGTFNVDQYTYMSHALRITRGEVPYRDFFEFIPPLSFWLLAGVYQLFGASLAVTQVFQTLIIWFSAGQLYALARRLGVGPWTAWLPGLVLVMGLYPHWPGFSHHWVVLPFLLGALQAALRALGSPDRKWWAMAGVLTGLTLITLQSDGIVLAAALAGLLLMLALLGGLTWPQAASALGALVAGLLGPVVLAAAVLAMQGALGAAWECIWVWTTSHYKVQGGINHHPLLTDLPAVLSPVKQLPAWYGRAYHFVALFALALGAAGYALAWGLGMVWRRLRTGAPVDRVDAGHGLAALTALGFVLLASRGRADFVHVALYTVPAALLATAVAHRWAERATAPEQVLLRWVPNLALLAFAITGGLMQAKAIMTNPTVWLSRETPDARVSRTPVLEFLRAEAKPTDTLTAMPHGGYYYFYGPRPASRYSVMFPPALGYNPASEFQAFGRELEARRPTFIVVAPWAWGGEAATRKPYEALFPPGYTRVKTLKTAQWGGAWPAYVYRREDSGASLR